VFRVKQARSGVSRNGSFSADSQNLMGDLFHNSLTFPEATPYIRLQRTPTP